MGTTTEGTTRRAGMPALAVLLLMLLAVPPGAAAHRVTIFSWVQGDTVHTESKFGNGRPVRDGTVTVFDAAGIELLSGRTDPRGRFAFPAPQPDRITIELRAGAGHRAAWNLHPEDFEPAPPATAVNAPPAPPPSAGTRPGRQDPALDELAAVLEASLDRKLAPIHQRLARLEGANDGPSPRDVAAGLGYIMGLVGIGAWWAARRRQRGDAGRTMAGPGGPAGRDGNEA